MIARHNNILKELEKKEYVLVQDLCEKYNVSSVTIPPTMDVELFLTSPPN